MPTTQEHLTRKATSGPWERFRPGALDAAASNPRGSGASPQPFESELPWAQRGFLGALDMAERAGLGGTALRLYNAKVGRGDRTPITEKDFTPDELDMFRRLIEAEKKRSGPRGTVQPSTYDDVMMQGGANPSYDMIGGFQYETAPDGSAVIRDSYDFNMDRAVSNGIEAEGGLFQALQSPVGFAAAIGRKRLPDSSGGVPIELQLSPLASAARQRSPSEMSALVRAGR